MIQSHTPTALPRAPVDGRMAAARHAFSAPERVALTAQEAAALAGAAEPPLRHEGLKLARWTLGAGPRVVLVPVPVQVNVFGWLVTVYRWEQIIKR